MALKEKGRNIDCNARGTSSKRKISWHKRIKEEIYICTVVEIVWPC